MAGSRIYTTAGHAAPGGHERQSGRTLRLVGYKIYARSYNELPWVGRQEAPLMIRLQGLRSDCRWTLAMALTAGLAFTGCSNSTRQAAPKPRHSTASSLLPSY